MRKTRFPVSLKDTTWTITESVKTTYANYTAPGTGTNEVFVVTASATDLAGNPTSGLLDT